MREFRDELQQRLSRFVDRAEGGQRSGFSPESREGSSSDEQDPTTDNPAPQIRESNRASDEVVATSGELYTLEEDAWSQFSRVHSDSIPTVVPARSIDTQLAVGREGAPSAATERATPQGAIASDDAAGTRLGIASPSGVAGNTRHDSEIAAGVAFADSGDLGIATGIASR